MEVYNGNSIYFWSDHWLPHGLLIDTVREADTRQLRRWHFATVSNVVVDGEWSFRRCRQLALAQLIAHIKTQHIPNPDRGDDRISWRHSLKNFRDYFSASTTWEQVKTRQDRKSWSQIIWFSQGVPRYAFIAWLAVIDRLSTWTHMRTWDLSSFVSCMVSRMSRMITCSSPVHTRLLYV